MTDLQEVETDTTDRERARKRVEARRNLQGTFIAYLVINAFLVGVWALTGAGYFWPAWIMAGWGVGLLLGLWSYWRGPVTDADVDRELQHMGR